MRSPPPWPMWCRSLHPQVHFLRTTTPSKQASFALRIPLAATARARAAAYACRAPGARWGVCVLGARRRIHAGRMLVVVVPGRSYAARARRAGRVRAHLRGGAPASGPHSALVYVVPPSPGGGVKTHRLSARNSVGTPLLRLAGGWRSPRPCLGAGGWRLAVARQVHRAPGSIGAACSRCGPAPGWRPGVVTTSHWHPRPAQAAPGPSHAPRKGRRWPNVWRQPYPGPYGVHVRDLRWPMLPRAHFDSVPLGIGPSQCTRPGRGARGRRLVTGGRRWV